MNVQSLILSMRKRPEMYIGSQKIEALYQFISGFLFSNIINQQADHMDYEFKNRFHTWVKSYIEGEKHVELPEQRNWLYYIIHSFGESERMEVFFGLCEIFFEQVIREQKSGN